MEIISHTYGNINSSNQNQDDEFDILALPDKYEHTPPLNRGARRYATAAFKQAGKGDSRRVARAARARRSLSTVRIALKATPTPLRSAAARQPRQHNRQQTRSAHGAAKKSGDDGDGGDGGSGDGEPPHQHPILLDYADLAALLKVAVGTLKNRYSQAPHTLPPAILIPGCRGPRWLLATVLRWLEAHEAEAQAPAAPVTPKRRVGRPRIAQAGQGGASC